MLKHFGFNGPSSGLKDGEQGYLRICNNGKIKIYTKKDHISYQSFNPCSFSKNYHMINLSLFGLLCFSVFSILSDSF